jgi:putative transposase
MISYKYKLYRTKNNKHFDNMLRESCFVWNHALALQKRYYALYGKYVSAAKMQKHFAKRKIRTYLHSQSAQEILQRLDKSYQRFFRHLSKRPPKFKKSKDFRSFCYKQGGFILNGNVLHINSVDKDFKFSLSRPYIGKVKQLWVKRSHLNEYYICIVTDAIAQPYVKSHNGASVGIDFGLKTYMTFSDGEKLAHPQFLKSDIRALRKASRKHSCCLKGSNHRERSRLALCRLYERISNKRMDYQWKLAHELCRKYDTIFIEDLNLSGMSRLWGRKMSDLGHSQFCIILDCVAAKYGCCVHKIDKWFPSSRLCDCGHKNDNLKLNDREWVCTECGQVHDRDIHASEMILRRGIYELVSDSKTIEPLGFQGSHV